MSLRQQNKIRARNNIIAAAESLIAEQGVENTTTRQIAERAGVSYQTLYNYFPTKGQILQATLEAELNEWTREVENVVKRYDGDLIDSLDQIIEIGARMTVGEHRALWEQLLPHMLQMVKDDRESTNMLSTVAHEHFYALLNLAQGMGHLQQDVDLHLLAHTLFCLSDYAVLQFFLSETPIEQQLQTVREQFQLIIAPYQTGA